MKKKVGFFGGGFDPIHIGHISMAIQIKEKLSLDDILLVPAFCSPFKWDAPPRASTKDRLSMVELVCKEIPFFSSLSWELSQKGPSYTIDTLRYIKQESEYKSADLYLLMTEEGEKGFSSWKESSEIEKMVTILVGTRKRLEKSRFQQVNTKTMEISSSEIRERLHKKKCVKHLLLAPVLQYIEKHGLYKENV